MAAVKEPRAAVSVARRELPPTAPSQLNMIAHLLAAHKALKGETLSTKGVLRELVSNDRRLALSIGGHRGSTATTVEIAQNGFLCLGMGENLLNDHEPLALPSMWRENTVKSFVKAYEHGARFVEFDVQVQGLTKTRNTTSGAAQVTRDGVPVIWHDDEIVFGSQSHPVSCQIADLSLAEFRSLGPQRLEQNGQMRELISLHRRFRSRKRVPVESVSEPNTAWHCFDEDSLPSLEHVLAAVPIELGLNLEIKLATPATLAQTPLAEIERMTTPIVELLKQHPGRQILISSFDPDICIEAKRKLDVAGLEHLPVMLLTTGGSELHADPRRMSISNAISLCLEHRFRGLVIDSTQLRQESHQISVAQRHNLQVMTYGLENDDVSWLMEQWRLGVHGAIVDDMAQVARQFIQQVKQTCLSLDVSSSISN